MRVYGWVNPMNFISKDDKFSQVSLLDTNDTTKVGDPIALDHFFFTYPYHRLKSPTTSAHIYYDVYSFCISVMIIEIGIDQVVEFIDKVQNLFLYF